MISIVNFSVLKIENQIKKFIIEYFINIKDRFNNLDIFIEAYLIKTNFFISNQNNSKISNKKIETYNFLKQF